MKAVKRRGRLNRPWPRQQLARKDEQPRRRIRIALAADRDLRRAGLIRAKPVQAHARPDGHPLMIHHPPGHRALAQHADVRLHRLPVELETRVGEAPGDWTEIILLACDQSICDIFKLSRFWKEIIQKIKNETHGFIANKSENNRFPG